MFSKIDPKLVTEIRSFGGFWSFLIDFGSVKSFSVKRLVNICDHILVLSTHFKEYSRIDFSNFRWDYQIPKFWLSLPFFHLRANDHLEQIEKIEKNHSLKSAIFAIPPEAHGWTKKCSMQCQKKKTIIEMFWAHCFIPPYLEMWFHKCCYLIW